MTQRVVQPGWYTIVPLKGHPGGRCNYCLAVVRYTDKVPYHDVPETLNHALRREDSAQEVVWELEGFVPDYERHLYDGQVEADRPVGRWDGLVARRPSRSPYTNHRRVQ